MHGYLALQIVDNKIVANTAIYSKPKLYSGTSNKGHNEDDINSGVLSFAERLSSFTGSKCISIGKAIFGTSTCVYNL